MRPSRSIAIRSLPGGARRTVGGSVTPATCPSSSVIHSTCVEPDAAPIGKQGPDPYRGCRRVGAHADAAAVQVLRRDRATLDVADQVWQRIPAEYDDRQQPQRNAARTCHQERHQRQFGDVELEVPDDALEGLVGHGDVREGQWHERRCDSPAAQRVRRGMVAEECLQWQTHSGSLQRLCAFRRRRRSRGHGGMISPA